jgi:WD40 repeat protein
VLKVLCLTYISLIARSQLPETQATTENVAEQQYRLSTMLGLDEHVENGMLPFEDGRVPGSCAWLAARPLYQIWQAAQPSSRPIFWLEGNPGFGKSTLCAHTIEGLAQRELSCSYFFFKHGDATRSTVAKCLIALANQMAMSDLRVLEGLLAMQHDILQIKHWDEKTIWRKLFVGCIFPSQTKTTHYWIIDAVDECKRFPVLLSLLAQIPPNLRLFVTSRTTLQIEKNRTMLVDLCEVYRLQEKDTLDDIGLFVESRMDRLPAGNDDDRQRLKQNILEKSSGSFLWTTLVVKELELAYSEESAEEILNETPVDMNQFYAKMVETILENRRAVKLAASIFLWTLFSLRPLKVSELQSALKLDTGQTVHNLEKSITAICGQLVIVNSMNEVGIVHETARAYLLQDGSFPGLAEGRQSHTRIAGLCLYALAEHFPRNPTIWQRRPIPSDFDIALTSYACEYFSDHLYLSTSEDPLNWDLLNKFLQKNTSIWIESLAKMGNLRPIPRTAKNLQGYMKRRLKYTSILDTTRDDLEMWSTDLLRLHGKFGSHLQLSPSSIHSIIPAMCPSDSNLAVKNTSRLPQSRLRIKGVIEQSWNDCLIQIDYPARQTGALAHGDRHVAVALSDGMVTVYHHDSAHPRSMHDHGERVKTLSFSDNDQYLASSGLKSVKVWDITSGTLLYTFDTVRQALFMHFVGDSALVAATQDSRVIAWHLHDGTVSRQWSWTDKMLVSGQNQPQQQPAKAHISESGVMAVCYRGLPVQLFDLETEQFIGCCSRDTMSLNGGTSNHIPVDSLAIKESSESFDTLLIVSYGDGELVIYDVASLQLRSRTTRVYAHSLACSPNGYILVTGSSQGAIQIFEFGGGFGDQLTLIYRIDAYDDGIRSMSFSRDGSNFADIRGSQYRMWQPTVLMRSDDQEFSQKQLNSATSVAPKSVPMSEGALAAETTTICSHPNAGYVFCGKQNGHVVAFETSHATQSQFLYQHATNISVTATVYNKIRSILASVDESGRILVYTVVVTDIDCKIDSHVADIRTNDTAMTLLLNPSGTMILVQRKTALDIWSMEGIKGHTISRSTLDGDGQTYSDRVLLNHPLDPHSFICVDSDELQTHSWEGQVSISGLSIENHSHTDKSLKSPTTIVNIQRASPGSPSASATLRAWRPVEQANTLTFAASTPILGIHVDKIRQIIAVEGDLALFIDTSFWVCSIDLSKNARSTLGIKRHFFLLSEWRNSDGRFVVEYIPKDRDFVVAKRDGILVLSAGLRLEEPWLPHS